MNQINNIKLLKKHKQRLTNNLQMSHDRESQWNNRYHLAKIPKYDAQKDSNCFLNNPQLGSLSQQDLQRIRNELYTNSFKKTILPLKERNINTAISSKNQTSKEKRDSKRAKTPETNNSIKELKRDLKGTTNKANKANKSAKNIKQYNLVHNDQFNVIQNMWDYLGVSAAYKNIYMNIARELETDIEKDYFEFEIQSLKKLNEILGVIHTFI